MIIAKKIPLIDAIGAIISAFMLGVVLVHFGPYFGIPKETLYILATLPIFFAVYDLIIYFFVDTKLSLWLRIITIINLLYCLLSLGFAFFHVESITWLGWAYIIIEIIIVIFIARYELRSSFVDNC